MSWPRAGHLARRLRSEHSATGKAGLQGAHLATYCQQHAPCSWCCPAAGAAPQLLVPHLIRERNCEDLRQKVGLKVSVCIPWANLQQHASCSQTVGTRLLLQVGPGIGAVYLHPRETLAAVIAASKQDNSSRHSTSCQGLEVRGIYPSFMCNPAAACWVLKQEQLLRSAAQHITPALME